MTYLTDEAARQIEEALHNVGNALMCLTATRKLRPMYQEMRDDAVDGCNKALSTIRAARAQADHIAGAGKVIGCAYCDNPLFAGTKCNNCGRVTLAEQEKPQKERRDFMDGYDAGMADAKRMQQAEQEPIGNISLWHNHGYQNHNVEYYGTLPDGLHQLYAAPVRTKDLTAKWIDPNDKSQKQYLPHIGEKVLFCCDGEVYYGHHTGGAFQKGYGVTKSLFPTWDCMWMPLPAAAVATDLEKNK